MGSYGMNISGGRDMKEKILKCLREAEDYVSGQELCQMFDVSRTAIWKVMNQLKEEGYVIIAVVVLVIGFLAYKGLKKKKKKK